MKLIKTLIFILLFVFSIEASAQSLTQKWNDFYKRTEFYDSYGNLQGWAKYNDFYNRMEYFDKNGNLQKYEEYNDFYQKKINWQKIY